MFFNTRSVSWVFFGCLLTMNMALTGCGEFLRGKRQSDQVMNVEMAENACLKGLPQFLNSYFADKATGTEIDQNFACVQSALKTFLKYTRGAAPDRYSDRELQHFFNRYLLSENQISDSFLLQAMKLKTLMVGGTRTAFTRTELDQISESLNIVKGQMKAINGLSSLLLFQKSPQEVSFAELKAAQAKITEAATTVILSFKLSGSEFEFSDVQDFVYELNAFTGSQGKLSEFLRWFPLMKGMKMAFLGEHPVLGTRQDWQNAISWSVESYFLGQEFYYHLRSLNFDNAADWKLAIRFSDWLLDLVDRSPMLKGKGYIVAKDIDQIIKSVVDLKLIKSKLNFEVIKNTYKKAIFHLVDGKKEGRGETFEVSEFNRSQFAVIKFEYEVWRQTQIMLTDIFVDQSVMGVEGFLEKTRAYDRNQCMRSTLANRVQLASTFDEWLQLLNLKRTAFLDARFKIVLDRNLSNAQVSINSVSIQSAIRSLTRLTLRGYGDGIGRDLFSSAMTEDRIVDLEFNFREFGQAVGFLDSRQNGAPQRTFKEGNFFTFSGNGDQRFDGREIFELLHFMISAGSTLTSDIEDKIERAGGHLPVESAMARAKSQEPVFRKVIESQFDEIFSNMPLLVEAQKKMPRQEWSEIYSIVMQISRVEDAQFGMTEFAEIRSFASILQYVESIFLQFDRDGSGQLTVDELLIAEPRFHRLIKELSPIKTDWVVREAFLYLVSYGKIPTLSADLWTFAKNRVAGRPLGPVTRLQLFRVLGVLKNNAL